MARKNKDSFIVKFIKFFVSISIARKIFGYSKKKNRRR